MHFDDGSADVMTHSYTYVIRINGNCDWSKLSLRSVIAHEYGHVLLGAQYHSKDEHSIMFWMCNKRPDQHVTEADRREMARAYPANTEGGGAR